MQVSEANCTRPEQRRRPVTMLWNQLYFTNSNGAASLAAPKKILASMRNKNRHPINNQKSRDCRQIVN